MCSLYPFSDLVKEPLFFLKNSRRYGKSAAYSYRKNILFVQYTTCLLYTSYECVVEVPCYVDGNGISIPKLGDLPLGCAAVCSQSIWVQRLAVEAAVAGDVKLLKQAALMDPLTGAVCNPPEIWQMIDEMLIAEAEWLPQYTQAIAEAKERFAKGDLIPTKDGYQGCLLYTSRCV